MIELIKELCTLNGVSGNEEKVSAYIKKKARPFADELFEDSIGNLFVFKKGKKRRSAPLMVSAHMDEVGLIVTEICDDGYLKFDFAGGIDRRVVIGKRVLVGDKRIPGVIGLKAVHLTTKEERKRAPKLSSLRIDIGCDKRGQVEKLVSLGDAAVFDGEPVMLGEHRLKARAIDDRFGCAVMLSLMQEEIEYDTFFVFTVQEESGCRGAQSAAYTINPAFSLVLESTTAADVPGSEGAARVCALGEGAVIGYMDGGTIYDKKLFSLIRGIAEKNGVNWQMKSRVAGGTDASKIHISRDGVRTTSLSIPTRYIHSPSCVADVRDMRAVCSLAREFINCEEEALNG